MTQLHPKVADLIRKRALVNGLHVSLAGYSGLVRADHEGQALDGHVFTETGKVRLTGPDAPVAGGVTQHFAPDGPTIRHTFRVRGDAPGIELDLSVTNGEVYGPRTPHLLERFLAIEVPEGWTLTPRFEWIKVTGVPDRPREFLVDLGCNVYQGVMLDVALALVPTESWEAHRESILKHLRAVPWLQEDGPGFVDGLPRHQMQESLKLMLGAYTFIEHGAGLDEADYLEWDYGAATGGMSIRFDFGAEFESLPIAVQYHLMQRWSWEIHRRPQRGYLTMDGEPFDVYQAAPGFNMSIGPTDTCSPARRATCTGSMSSSSDSHYEEFIFGERDLKGSIDLQHGPRWFGPDAFLAQKFGCPMATQRIRFMAAAARADTPDPLSATPGTLNRAHGWNAVLQATAAHLGYPQGAGDWLRWYVEACTRDQTEHGGICSWTHNKEAKDYARKFVWDNMPEADRPASYKDLPVVPVTSYSEDICFFGAECATRVGVSIPDEVMSRWAHFICETSREAGHSGPCYRRGVDGERMSPNDTSWYHGATLAVAKRREVASVDGWGDAFTNGGGLDWLTSQPESKRANTWHLMGLLKPGNQ
jgi:hypothetical protein